ncbi:hypothetical protein D3C86_1262150 [compost metagenome]
MSLKTRPVMACASLLTKMHSRSAPATIHSAGIFSTLPASTTGGADAAAAAGLEPDTPRMGDGAMTSFRSRQLALTGFTGQPAGDVSVMVTGTPTLPVIVCAPIPRPGALTVMVSRATLRPDSAKSKRWVPEPLITSLTMRSFGGRRTATGPVESSQSASFGKVVQSGSPPPLRLMEFVPPSGPTAVASTCTGISTEKLPGMTPAATLQRTTTEPAGEQPLRTPVVLIATSTGGPASVMPLGKTSSSTSGAVVAAKSTTTSTT